MKHKDRVFLILVLVISVAVFSGCGKKAEKTGSITSKVNVKSALNTVKVLQEQDVSNYPDAAISIELCKGESEGAQIILTPTEDDVDEYTTVVSDLKSKNGDKISEEAIVVYVQRYGFNPVAYGNAEKGYYPDALIPINYIEEKRENKIEKGKNQGLWIDISVPEDAKRENIMEN